MTFDTDVKDPPQQGGSARSQRAAYDLKRTKEWLDEQIAFGKKRRHAMVTTITPTLAQFLLDRNPINRPLSKTNCSDLASDIASGRFEFNGESIVVSDTGVLLDGQHRCAQVIATGACIESVLVFGPKETARFTIDTGKPKSLSNFLKMRGRTYTASLGPALNYFLQWREFGSIESGGSAVGRRPSKAACLAADAETPGLQTSAEFTFGCMTNVRSHAVLTFCHYVFWKKAGREAADEFMQKLIDGDGLKKGNPILYCRNRLLGMTRAVDGPSRIELVFKCWNAWRLGHGIDSHFRLTGGKLPKVER